MKFSAMIVLCGQIFKSALGHIELLTPKIMNSWWQIKSSNSAPNDHTLEDVNDEEPKTVSVSDEVESDLQFKGTVI